MRNQGYVLKEYEEFVVKMMSKQSMRDKESVMATAGLGLSGEAGEVSDTIKKLLFHDKPFTEEIRQDMILELGDIMFYLTLCATQVLNSSLEEVFDRNIAKLLERYKTGTFTTAEFLAKEAKK